MVRAVLTPKWPAVSCSRRRVIGMSFARALHVALSTLSAATCVNRLCELGFTVRRRAPGMSLLRMGDRLVIVPDVTIEPEMLRAILRSAEVSETEFFRRVQRSGVYARMKDGEEEEEECLSSPTSRKR